MRLIDVDSLPSVVGTRDELPMKIVIAIHDAPIIDAVPVVRCKDCKYRNHLDCGMQSYDYDDDGILRMSADWTRDDGFCYWGESKDV